MKTICTIQKRRESVAKPNVRNGESFPRAPVTVANRTNTGGLYSFYYEGQECRHTVRSCNRHFRFESPRPHVQVIVASYV